MRGKGFFPCPAVFAKKKQHAFQCAYERSCFSFCPSPGCARVDQNSLPSGGPRGYNRLSKNLFCNTTSQHKHLMNVHNASALAHTATSVKNANFNPVSYGPFKVDANSSLQLSSDGTVNVQIEITSSEDGAEALVWYDLHDSAGGLIAPMPGEGNDSGLWYRCSPANQKLSWHARFTNPVVRDRFNDIDIMKTVMHLGRR